MEYNFQTLQIDITNRCNLSCKHCGRSFINKTLLEPSFKLLTGIIIEAKKIGFKEVVFSGGEPTFRKNFFDLAEFVKNKELSAVVTTNGTFNKNILEKFIRSKINRIEISLDGLQEDHERIRGAKGIFENIIDNILALQKNNKLIVIKMVLLKDNINHLENFIKYLSLKQIFNLNVRNVIPCKKKKDCFEENIFKDKIIYRLIKYLSKKYKMNIFSDNPRLNLLDKNYIERLQEYGNIFDGSVLAGCLAGVSNFYINSKLEVFPCSYLSIKIGDLNKESLSKIVRRASVKFSSLRGKLQEKCGMCLYRYVCGGCRAVAYSKGNILGEDFTCSI